MAEGAWIDRTVSIDVLGHVLATEPWQLWKIVLAEARAACLRELPGAPANSPSVLRVRMLDRQRRPTWNPAHVVYLYAHLTVYLPGRAP